MFKKATISIVLLTGSFVGFAAADPVIIQSTIPYAADAKVAQKVRNECVELGAEFGEKYEVEVQLSDTLDPSAKGRVLQMEITEAVSQGNAFIGHRKFSSARGTLYENGEKVASFEALRQSGGGAFAGYKGSCSVLGRTVKAMGKDVAQWLQAPTDNAALGDM
jgi:hypothetical protein